MTKDLRPPRSNVEPISRRPDRPVLLQGETLSEAVRTLVDGLALDPDAAMLLVRASAALCDRQRIPRAIVAELRDGPPHKTASTIAKTAAALSEQLASVDQEIKTLLDIFFVERSLAFEQFIEALVLVRDVATAKAKQRKRRSGRPRDEITRNTLSMLLPRVEAVLGKRVGLTSEKERGKSDPHLTGEAGRFITEWFKLVDPTVTSATLYSLVKDVRKAALTNPERAAQKETELQMHELFAYRHLALP